MNFFSFSKSVLLSFPYPLFPPPSPVPLKSVSQSRATLHTDCHVALVFFNLEQASDICFFTFTTLTFLRSAGWVLYGKCRNLELSGSSLWSDSGCMFVPPLCHLRNPSCWFVWSLAKLQSITGLSCVLVSIKRDGIWSLLNFFTLKLFAS